MFPRRARRRGRADAGTRGAKHASRLRIRSVRYVTARSARGSDEPDREPKWRTLCQSARRGAHGARVDGSAYLEMGLTKVLALVSGPHEARRSAEQHDRATIACTCSLASFAGPERKRRRTADAGGDRGGSGSDRQLAEVALAMQRTLETAVVISACVDQRVRALRDRV